MGPSRDALDFLPAIVDIANVYSTIFPGIAIDGLARYSPVGIEPSDGNFVGLGKNHRHQQHRFSYI